MPASLTPEYKEACVMRPTTTVVVANVVSYNSSSTQQYRVKGSCGLWTFDRRHTSFLGSLDRSRGRYDFAVTMRTLH